jgi:hypothetical protein
VLGGAAGAEGDGLRHAQATPLHLVAAILLCKVSSRPWWLVVMG